MLFPFFEFKCFARFSRDKCCISLCSVKSLLVLLSVNFCEYLDHFETLLDFYFCCICGAGHVTSPAFLSSKLSRYTVGELRLPTYKYYNLGLDQITFPKLKALHFWSGRMLSATAAFKMAAHNRECLVVGRIYRHYR